jgi:hypothetical protein
MSCYVDPAMHAIWLARRFYLLPDRIGKTRSHPLDCYRRIEIFPDGLGSSAKSVTRCDHSEDPQLLQCRVREVFLASNISCILFRATPIYGRPGTIRIC